MRCVVVFRERFKVFKSRARWRFRKFLLPSEKKVVLSSFWRIQRRGAAGLEFKWFKAFAFVEGVDTDAVRREQGLQGLVGGTG